MRQLYAEVLAQLRAQRESESASKLWEQIWKAYDSGGAEEIQALIDSLATPPAEGDAK